MFLRHDRLTIWNLKGKEWLKAQKITKALEAGKHQFSNS